MWRFFMSEVPCIHAVEHNPFIKVNLPHAINLRGVYGANVVTRPFRFRGNEILVLHRVVHVK